VNLKKVQQIVSESSWTNPTKLPGEDLRGLDLREIYLNNADLTDTNLEGTNLRGTDLGGAKLNDAILTKADLRGACLFGANLRGANLSGANLQGAVLNAANLNDITINYCIGDGERIKSLQVGLYEVAYTQKYLAIGCTQLSIEEWRNYIPMGSYRYEYWKKYSPLLWEIMKQLPAEP
jgi:hypothetical protein